MVCPPSRGFVSLVSQLVSQLVFLLVSQLVCLLVSLCGGWSDFAFFSNSVLLGVLNAFLRCPPWCWMVCPPSEGLVSPCLPLSPFLFPFVGWCVRLPEGLVSPCLPLSPLVSPCLPLSPEGLGQERCVIMDGSIHGFEAIPKVQVVCLQHLVLILWKEFRGWYG